ncbi:MAG TPA: TadE family protein [Myxococcota bacterium]|nr:TadE family protein [Myxococcota bacterium]
MEVNEPRRDRRAGMAMVEFVIILPILLMLVFAIAEFGVLFGRWQTISNAAREGARTAVVFRAPCDSTAVTAEVKQRVKDYASPLGIALTDANITVSGVCGTSTSSSTVSVTKPYSFDVLPNIAGSVSPTIDLVGSSVMRNEGNG